MCNYCFQDFQQMQIIRKLESSTIMEFRYFLNMIFLFVVNFCFLFSGICLNSLVIISFWRSAQLRKKLCYFMIMTLSCCDLFVVLTNHLLTAYVAMFWLTRNEDASQVGWVRMSDILSSAFIGPSLLILLVMNFERYLATYYPIFHRTSVTKKKLLSLLATLIIVVLVLLLMSLSFAITFYIGLLIFLIIFTPPMLFINYKLLAIAKKSRRNRVIAPGMIKTFSLKNISSCLLAVAFFVVLSIPTFVYIGLRMNSEKRGNNLDDAHLVGMWAKTIASMNGTFNCLLFYWKNAILRMEGMKVIKAMKLKCIDDYHPGRTKNTSRVAPIHGPFHTS